MSKRGAPASSSSSSSAAKRAKEGVDARESVAETLGALLVGSLYIAHLRMAEVAAATPLIPDVVAIVLAYDVGCTPAESTGALSNLAAIVPMRASLAAMCRTAWRRLRQGQVAEARQWIAAGRAASERAEADATRFEAGEAGCALSEAQNKEEAFHNVRFSFNDALWLAQHAQEVLVAALGEEHKASLGAAECIAGALRTQGKHDAALEMHGRVLRTKEARLGADHLDVARTLNNMANVYKEQGKHDAALEMFGRALRIREARRGADYPDVAATLFNMAIVYKNQGKYDAALEMYGRALRIREARLGADHPSVADTLNDMGCMYMEQSKFDAALEMYGRALRIREARRGADHPSVADTLNNMAVVYKKQRKYDSALEMYGRALRIYEARLGAYHPDVAMTLFNMALVHESQGRLDAALDMARRSRAIYQRAGQVHIVSEYHDRVIARIQGKMKR